MGSECLFGISKLELCGRGIEKLWFGDSRKGSRGKCLGCVMLYCNILTNGKKGIVGKGKRNRGSLGVGRWLGELVG